jgi:hypothetical protein
LGPTRESVDAGGVVCGADSQTSAQIKEIYDQLVTQVDELKVLIEDNLANFGDDLRQLIKITEDVDSSLDSADIFFYILIAISCCIIGIILAMLVGVFFSAKGVSNCFTRCITNVILWPTFTFLLVLSWVFATLFLTTSIAGADFCITPDVYVTALLNKNKDKFDSAIFAFIIFYVSGCTVRPLAEDQVMEVLSQVAAIVNTTHNFSELVGNMSVAALAQICGVGDFSAEALQQLATLIHDVSHVLNRSMVGLLDVISCGSFNPIYTTFVHDAICTSGVEGLTYIFATTLTISICSMMMIMFRAALYPVKESNAIATNETTQEVSKYAESPPNEENAEDEDEKVVT